MAEAQGVIIFFYFLSIFIVSHRIYVTRSLKDFGLSEKDNHNPSFCGTAPEVTEQLFNSKEIIGTHTALACHFLKTKTES